MDQTMTTQGPAPVRAEMMQTEAEPVTQREPAIARWRAAQAATDPKRLS